MVKLSQGKMLLWLSVVNLIFNSLYFVILSVVFYPRILLVNQRIGMGALVRASVPFYISIFLIIVIFSLGALLEAKILIDKDKTHQPLSLWENFLAWSLILILLTLLLRVILQFSGLNTLA